MKKVFMLLVVTMLFTSIMNVNAMTKSELQKKLTASYTVNGSTIKVTNAQAVLIEEYLQQNDVSSSDATYIANKVDEALAIMRNGNATSLKELTASEKNKIIAIINDVSNNTAVKVKVSKGNQLTVYNLDGTVFATITDIIKYTSSNTAIAGAASLASLIG